MAKLVLNICVGESGDRLQKAAKVRRTGEGSWVRQTSENLGGGRWFWETTGNFLGILEGGNFGGVG